MTATASSSWTPAWRPAWRPRRPVWARRSWPPWARRAGRSSRTWRSWLPRRRSWPLGGEAARRRRRTRCGRPGDVQGGQRRGGGPRGAARPRRATSQAEAESVAAAEARVTTLSERSAHLDESATVLKARLQAAEDAVRALVEQLDAARARVGQAEVEREEQSAAKRDAADQHTAWSARVDALAQALDAAHARAGSDHLSGLDGALGPLLDLVEIDTGWEAAVEAALGEALAAVVVADADSARRALDHLDRADVGGGVLSALGLGSSPLRPASPAPAAGRRVRDHVRAAAPGVDRLLDELLHGAVAVEGGWTEAFDLSFAHPGAVVVTRQGDRFSAPGFRLGLGGAGATASALEGREAPRGRRRGGAERTRWCRRRSDGGPSKPPRQAFASATALLDAHDAQVTVTAEQLGRVQRERDELLRGLAAARADVALLEAGRDRGVAAIVELERALESLEADEASEADDARRRHQARTRREVEVRGLAARRRDLAVRSAGIEERSSMLEQRLDQVQRRLSEGVKAQADASQRIAPIGRSAVAVERLDRPRRCASAGGRGPPGRAPGPAPPPDRRGPRRVRPSRPPSGAGRGGASAGELAEHQRRAEIGEAETRTRLEAAVEHVRRELDTEPRPRWPPSSRRWPMA